MSKAIMKLKTNEINVASWKFDKSKNLSCFSDSTIGDTVYPSSPTKGSPTPQKIMYIWALPK